MEVLEPVARRRLILCLKAGAVRALCREGVITRAQRDELLGRQRQEGRP